MSEEAREVLREVGLREELADLWLSTNPSEVSPEAARVFGERYGLVSGRSEEDGDEGAVGANHYRPFVPVVGQFVSPRPGIDSFKEDYAENPTSTLLHADQYDLEEE